MLPPRSTPRSVETVGSTASIVDPAAADRSRRPMCHPNAMRPCPIMDRLAGGDGGLSTLRRRLPHMGGTRVEFAVLFLASAETARDYPDARERNTDPRQGGRLIVPPGGPGSHDTQAVSALSSQ